MSNRRTKLRDNKKSPRIPENFERKPLKEREKNSLKDREKTDDKYNYYDILLPPINWCKPPKIIYYELRIWKYHEIITINVYTTLKEALEYYKRKHLKELEENNQCFVEIVKIDNLNPRYK